MNDLGALPVAKPNWYDDTDVPWEAVYVVCLSNEYNLTRRRLLREWNRSEDEEDYRLRQLKEAQQTKWQPHASRAKRTL